MAPYDSTEMPWTSFPTHIQGCLLEAFPTFRLSSLRVAMRARMPVVEDHEVRFEVVAPEEGIETEDRDDDGDVVGVAREEISEESIGAVIDNVLVTLPVLLNPCFFVRMESEEADEKSLPSSEENSPRIAMAADTEFHQVHLRGEIMPNDTRMNRAQLQQSSNLQRYL